MPLISCPRFTAIKEGGKKNISVYLDFGCPWDASPIPHIPFELAKGCTRFCGSGVHLVIHDDRLSLWCCQDRWIFLPPSVVVSWWWCWARHTVFQALAGASLLTFFCADGSAKIVTGRWELVTTVLQAAFGCSIQCTVVGERKLVNYINLRLGLCLNPSELENRAVSANVDSIIRATKCIKQHRRKHDTENSGSQDTSLLNPICDGSGYGTFSFVLHPCMHTVMELSNDGDEFFGAALFCHDSPKAVSGDHVKCLGQMNIGRVEVNVLFLILLLHLSCRKHRVNCRTFLTEAALTLR